MKNNEILKNKLILILKFKILMKIWYTKGIINSANVPLRAGAVYQPDHVLQEEDL